MNYIDIILAIFLLWAAYKGFKNGLIIEVASLAALILGIFGAIKFSGLTADFLVERFDMTSKYLSLIAFAITFVCIVIVVHLLARILDKLVKAIALGFINRLSGVVFGIVKVVFILSIVLVILNAINRKANFLPKEKLDESFLYWPISNFAPAIFNELNFNEIRENLEDLQEKDIVIIHN
jgi:membrane protein required for colicin V production